MNPGDRVRETSTGRLAFVLYMSNIDAGQMMVRFDGSDYNAPVCVDRFEVLPSEPFRPAPASPVVVVKYHIAHWPYRELPYHHVTNLHGVPARWTPAAGAIVDEITVT